MDNAGLPQMIVKRLASGTDPDDIIYDICQQTEMKWPEAEALVRQIEAEQSQAIARRQFPYMFVVALAIFVGGVGLMGYGLYVFATVLSAMTATAVEPWNLPGVLQYIIQFAGLAIVLALFGTGMVLGSLLGMKRVWAAVLKV